jgi:hypothetical protein
LLGLFAFAVTASNREWAAATTVSVHFIPPRPPGGANQKCWTRGPESYIRSGSKQTFAMIKSKNPSDQNHSQFIGAIKKTIFENETKADFESKFVSNIKAATARMLVAKKIIAEIRPDLVKFHDKVPSPVILTLLFHFKLYFLKFC